jgi:signal transduction histidine kinase
MLIPNKDTESINLLVVDDDEMIRIFVKTTLKSSNYQVDEAANGLEALEKLSQKSYALAIVDLHMPDMNGEQLIKQVRSQDKFIGLIVLTGETNIDVSYRLLEDYDICDYLMKPMFKELQLQLKFSVKNGLNRREFLIQQDNYVSNLEYLKHQAELVKSDFLTQMNHELNTPMNVILGFGQLLDSMEQGLEPKQQGYVKQIVSAGWTLMEMLKKILNMSSVEFDCLNLKSMSIDVDSLIDEVINHFRPQADKSRLTLVNQPGCLNVLGDAVQLRSVVYGLVCNAIIYNREGGTVTVSSEQTADKTIRINVTDNGKGISEQRKKELFTPFNRLGAELKTISGAGVGLALAQRLIGAMHGKIGCESVEGEGSTFWIELPCAR